MSFYNSNSFTLPSLSILFCRLWLLALTTTTLNMLESGLASTSSLKQNNKYSFHIPKKQNTFWNPQILCEIIWIFLPYLSWFSTASKKNTLSIALYPYLRTYYIDNWFLETRRISWSYQFPLDRTYKSDSPTFFVSLGTMYNVCILYIHALHAVHAFI